MATYVNDLRLKEIATGDEAGTWGTSTNTNLELIGEALGFGTQDCFSSDADATTTVADGSTDPARAMYFKVTSSATLTATRTLTIAPNTVSRVMFIENATTGSQSITISQGSGASVTITTGKTKVVYLDGAGSGAAVVDAMAGVDPGVTDTLAEVLAAGNTTGGTSLVVSSGDDVTFTGASANVVFDSSDSALEFADNAKAKFGTGGDLEIYHDSSHSYIQDSAGTGNLKIRTNTVRIENAAGTELSATFVQDGAVTLYNDNNIKLATTSTGIDVTGTVTATGTSVFASLDISGDIDVDGTTNLDVVDIDGAVDMASTLAVGGVVTANAGVVVDNITIDGTEIDLSSGDLTLDVAGDITFDAGGGDFIFSDDGTEIGRLSNVSAGFSLKSSVSNKDLTFVGNDAGSDVTALTLDMSAAGIATFNSGINIGNRGSASDPTLQSAIDPDTGIFWGGSDILGFSTGGSERGRFDGSGNLLVNGTNATGKLVVDGDANAYTARINSSTTTGQAFGIRVRAGTNSSDSAVLVENTSASTMFAVRGDGNVGIGTSSPSEELEISAALPTIRLTDTDDSSYANIFYNAPNLIFDSDAGNSDGSSNIQFRIDGTEAARILSSGNVGIGTSSPEETLSVMGDFQVALNTSVTGRGLKVSTSNGSITDDTVAINAQASTGVLAFQTNSSERLRIDSSGTLIVKAGNKIQLNRADDARNMEIFNDNSFGTIETSNDPIKIASQDYTAFFVSGSEKARLTSDGRLGIGTSSPGRKLTIDSGHVRLSDDYKVEWGGGTNYVQGSNANNRLIFATNNSEGFRLDSSGNVGINQSSPTRKLHVTSSGSGVVATFGDSEANNTLEVTRTTSNASYAALLATSAVGGFIAGPTMTFSTSNSGGGSITERARLDSSGNFMVGTTNTTPGAGNTTAGISLFNDGRIFASKSANTTMSLSRNTSDGNILEFRRDGTSVGSVSVSSSATTYNTSSDQRLKDNIVDAPSASNDIDAIQVRSFDWKADGSHQKYGMIAQELQSVAPEAVTGDADSHEMMSVDYSKLVPMMMKEIQSLRARVAQLEGEN